MQMMVIYGDLWLFTHVYCYLPMFFHPISNISGKTWTYVPILNATLGDAQTIKHVHRKMACVKMFKAD